MTKEYKDGQGEHSNPKAKNTETCPKDWMKPATPKDQKIPFGNGPKDSD